MLNVSMLRVFQSSDFPLADDVRSLSEGVALVADYTNPTGVKVRPALGKPNEVFLGVAHHRVTHDLSASTSIDVPVETVGTDHIIRVAHDVISNSITGYTSAGAYMDNSHFTPDSEDPRKFKVTFDTSSSNSETPTHIVVTYRYSPTVAQSRAEQGDEWPGAPLTSTLGHVGVILRGEVFTNAFDTTCDWTNPVKVYITTGGLFTTTSGSNTQVPCVVTQLPSTGNGFLGIRL